MEPRGRHARRLLPPHAFAPRAHRLRRPRQGLGLGPRHRRPVDHDRHGVRGIPGEERHRRHSHRGHARSLSAADAAHRASPQGQRTGAVVAQRGLHPHRLRDGDPARRHRPRHQAGSGGLPDGVVRRQASASPRCAAARGRQERLRQAALARRRGVSGDSTAPAGRRAHQLTSGGDADSAASASGGGSPQPAGASQPAA